MPDIHITAIVSPKAKIADGVKIGPYCIIGDKVTIDTGTILFSHVNIQGNTSIGKNNKIYPYASLGTEPQDLKYKDEDTKLIVGDNNTIREYTTMNLGTVTGIGLTKVGDNNLFMMSTHIAHDCVVGNNTVFANLAQLAGHVVVEDFAIIGGFTSVVQFSTIGKYSYIGLNCVIRQNMPPFFIGKGSENFTVQGVNAIGLKRKGFSSKEILALKEAYKIIYKKGLLLKESLFELKKLADNSPETKEHILYLINFIEKAETGIFKS